MDGIRAAVRTVKDTRVVVGHAADSVAALRTELGSRIQGVEDRVSEIATDCAAANGKLDILTGMFDKQLTARLELDRTAQLATIDAGKQRAEFWRSVIIKVLAGAGVVWAAISAALLGR